MNIPLIFDIQKFSVHDGPGIRTIVFSKGCPLKCEWCANPESQTFAPDIMLYPDKCIGCGNCIKACEQGLIVPNPEKGLVFDREKCTGCGACTETCYAGSRELKGKAMTLDEIKKEVDKDLVFYKNSGGGITLSGGEAMCFPEYARELFRYYKEEQGVSTAIETCGCVPWENYEMVAPYLDLAMFDLKCMDDERHQRWTGGSNKQILENITKLAKVCNVVVRIPIIPTINDSDEDIQAFGEFIKTLENVNVVHILAYHNLGVGKYIALEREYTLNDIVAPMDERMEEIKAKFEAFGFEVHIGG